MTTANIIDLLIIAFGIPFVWALAVTLALWHERRENRKNNEVTREQIEAQLRDLVWVDFEEGNLRAQTGLPLDAYIQEYGGKYLASGSRTSFPENDIARLMPTIDDAKRELRAWQVELVYRLFKHD